MERHLPATSTTVRRNDADIIVRSSTIAPRERGHIESDGFAVITELGMVNLYLSPAAAIDLGNALIEASHHFRAHAHALFESTEGEPTEQAA